MSYEEYQAWQLYFVIEPFGWGHLSALLYNLNRGEGKPMGQDELLDERLKEALEALSGGSEISGLSGEARRQAILQAVKRDMGIK